MGRAPGFNKIEVGTMNVSYKKKLASLPEEQAKLRERSKKRERSKRTLKARQKAAQQKYYRKKHPIVMRSRKRGKQRREVAEVLKLVKDSMKAWKMEELNELKRKLGLIED